MKLEDKSSCLTPREKMSFKMRFFKKLGVNGGVPWRCGHLNFGAKCGVV